MCVCVYIYIPSWSLLLIIISVSVHGFPQILGCLLTLKVHVAKNDESLCSWVTLVDLCVSP